MAQAVVENYLYSFFSEPTILGVFIGFFFCFWFGVGTCACLYLLKQCWRWVADMTRLGKQLIYSITLATQSTREISQTLKQIQANQQIGLVANTERTLPPSTKNDNPISQWLQFVDGWYQLLAHPLVLMCAKYSLEENCNHKNQVQVGKPIVVPLKPKKENPIQACEDCRDYVHANSNAHPADSSIPVELAPKEKEPESPLGALRQVSQVSIGGANVKNQHDEIVDTMKEYLGKIYTILQNQNAQGPKSSGDEQVVKKKEQPKNNVVEAVK